MAGQDQELAGRSWAQWTGPRTLEELTRRPAGEISEREQGLMRGDGWQSMERAGRTIWRHPEHTGGYWTGADTALEWARAAGNQTERGINA